MKTKIVLILSVLFVSLFLQGCGSKQVVFVEKRYATFTRSYKWNTTTSKLVCGTNYDGEFECNTRTSTTVHVRCSSTQTSTTLPPKPPEMSCDLQHGDYVSDSINYFIEYNDKDGNKGRYAITEYQWDYLNPGQRHSIVVMLGFVTEIVSE